MSVLRPALTNLLLKVLLEQRAVNLYGAPFSGRARLLKDVQELPNAKIYQFVFINMQDFAGCEYQTFLDNLTNQLSLTWKKNELMMPHTFQNVVRAGLAIGQKIIFLFHHFDILLDNNSHHFPNDFFNDLNSLKNSYPNFSCCCVTQKPHNLSFLKIKESSRIFAMDLYPIDTQFHPLTQQDIRNELARLEYHEEDSERLAYYIHQNTRAPMQLFLALTSIRHLKVPFEERIQAIERFRKTKYPQSSFLTCLFLRMAWKQ